MIYTITAIIIIWSIIGIFIFKQGYEYFYKTDNETFISWFLLDLISGPAVWLVLLSVGFALKFLKIKTR